MGLDNATVKEFANLINPFDKTSGEATVYGRVIDFNEIGGRPIVQLDGSSQRIPIRTTVKVKGPKGSQGDPDYYAGDRVLVRIKNHEALIVSNISTQMTTAEGAEDAAKQYVSDNGFIYAEKISGEQGDFYTLSADKFSATEITGALGHFITVNADKIITKAINSQIANIDTIKASDVVAGEGDFAYLNVDNVLDAKMANLDVANINKANIGSLLANMGLISSATIVEGHVTGYLDSVEVNANKITAGTLMVDRLYIKDQNNKWKMQTVDGQGQIAYVEAADRINERTITADKLVAHSITTDELNTTNITANQSSFMESLTNSLTTNYLFATQANVEDLVAHSVDAELAELDILNINEELKTQNIHLGEIVFDQPTKPEVMSGNPDYLLGIERETKTISAYDDTSLYSEGEYVTHYYSKDNFIPYPYNDATKTKNGITFTDNGDGSITCNGTATADAVYYCSVRGENGKCVLSNGSYIINGCPSGGSSSSYYMVASRTVNNTNKNYGSDLGSGITISLNGDDFGTDDVRLQVRIIVKSGSTVNNLTFYPKIRLATNEDANWYPFIKGVYKCIKPITTAELWDNDKWYYLRDAINGDQYEFDHVRYISKAFSYVGMIIHSTTLDTEAKVIAIYGGSSWIQHSGYILRGASSGVTPNIARKTGGNDNSIVPYHRHSVPSFDTIDGKGGHVHSSNNYLVQTEYPGAKYNPSGAFNIGSRNLSVVMTSAGAHNHTIQGHYTNYEGTENNTENANIPNYKSVYIWERVS